MSESDRRRDAWAAFLLSLVVPGAGQLWAGRWSCLAYFAAAGGLAAAPQMIGPFRWPALAALGLFSAEHARRCMELARWKRDGRKRTQTATARSRVVDRSGKGSRIDLAIEIDTPRTTAEVWALLADLPRFVAIDPLHGRVIVLGPALVPGVELAIEHVVFGITRFRFGKLLTWRDGCGYSFSDLSPKGALGLFPHVFDFAIEPGAREGLATRLTVRVRGKWTSRWLPCWAGRCWVHYVSREHALMLREALT